MDYRGCPLIWCWWQVELSVPLSVDVGVASNWEEAH